MLDSQQIQTIRETIRWVLAECNVTCKVTPFDHDFYRECVDEAVRRGFVVEGDHSVQTCMRPGVLYASTAGRHLNSRATQRWLALYTSCTLYIDEVFFHFPSEIPEIYLFSDRLIGGQRQGNPVLDALTDILQETPDLFRSIPSKLIVTSTYGHHNHGKHAIDQYRQLSGLAEGYAYIALSRREIPVTEYVQAIPELMQFINDINDIMSFYKEELAGEITNRISTMAACDKDTPLGSFVKLAKLAVDRYHKLVEILEGSPAACEQIKGFCAGYLDFHLSSERYNWRT
ncbi:isoprenoid synthase domain-containing protein [Chiua virens]|nr:isoprenoid synthase domain-containing protein [Chiua virens]